MNCSLVTQQTNVYNLLTQMQIASNAAQQNTVTKLNQVTDVESLLREAERIYELDKDLYEKKAIGSQEFKQSENNYNYHVAEEKADRTDPGAGFRFQCPAGGPGQTIR